VFDVLAEVAPQIRAGLPGRRVGVGTENASGEHQMAADVHADELLRNRLGEVDGVAEYGSEERADSHRVGDATGFSVAVDPLDGSSNLQSNNTMGTILTVYDEPLPAPGTAVVAAGYVLYGPITTMVTAVDGQVREEVIDDERTVVNPNLEIPADPTVYGFGGRVPDWPESFAEYAGAIETELKLRYGGSMVGDVTQVLTYGGIFAYPALESAPDGKLRLQFEANPMAYIVETAGGLSSDGTASILDVDPTGLHQRVPVHLGNDTTVRRLETALE
jgi:Fructose-1,6-bisphosphatase